MREAVIAITKTLKLLFKIHTVALGLLIVVPGCSSEPKDNVVLIIIDTVRMNSLGCYGNSLRPTNNIDAIAADGVRFDQAISTSGWTLPAVASLFTGAWPTVHGGLGRNVTLTRIRDEIPTAAEIFKKEGFNTLGFANAAFVSPLLGMDRGFDLFDHRHTYNWNVRRADETVDAAIEQIKKNRSKRNFIMIHLFDPHLDYDPPEGYKFKYTRGRTTPPPPIKMETCLQMYTENGKAPPRPEDVGYVAGVYLGEINFMDEQIGRLVRTLKDLGLYDHTTLIVTADHGEEFWDHSGFEHGHTLYDELIRIPLILKLPSRIKPAKQVVKAQVRFVDVAPTLFGIMGIVKPETFVGESLMPLVMGETGEHRDAFSESTMYGPQMISWRGERYKYILHLDPKSGEAGPVGTTGKLYDWREDPGEKSELSNQRPEIAREMRAELLEFYGNLLRAAENMSKPATVDMSPQHIKQLKSLGYIR